MNLTVCNSICKQCPFTFSAVHGWLGPHSLEEVLFTQEQSKLFSCHMLRKTDMTKEDIEDGHVKICRGFIASATKSGICFDNNTETGKALRKLQVSIAIEAKEDMDSILSNDEFAQYHNQLASKIKEPVDKLYQRLGYTA